MPPRFTPYVPLRRWTPADTEQLFNDFMGQIGDANFGILSFCSNFRAQHGLQLKTEVVKDKLKAKIRLFFSARIEDDEDLKRRREIRRMTNIPINPDVLQEYRNKMNRTQHFGGGGPNVDQNGDLGDGFKVIGDYLRVPTKDFPEAVKMITENQEFQRHAAWSPYQQGPIQHPQHQMQDQYRRWPTYQQQAHQNQYQHQMYHQQVEQARYRQLQMQHRKQMLNKFREIVDRVPDDTNEMAKIVLDTMLRGIEDADAHRSRLLLLAISSQPNLPLPEKSEMLKNFREIMDRVSDDKKEMAKIVLDRMLRGIEGGGSNG